MVGQSPCFLQRVNRRNFAVMHRQCNQMVVTFLCTNSAASCMTIAALRVSFEGPHLSFQGGGLEPNGSCHSVVHDTTSADTCLHANGGIAEGWGECVPSDINTPLHSLNLSCYRHISRSTSAKTTIRYQGIYLSAIGTWPFRSHTIATIHRLSSSKTNRPRSVDPIQLSSTGLWSLAAFGNRSVDPGSTHQQDCGVW